MPASRFAEFTAQISRARDLIGLGQAIGKLTFGKVDGSDLYRSAIVQAIAALDSYVHGIVLDRSVDILLGHAPTVSIKTKIGLGFNAIQEVVTAASETDRELSARRHVAQRLSLETFQKPDAIASVLSTVGVSKLWSKAFPKDTDRAIKSLSLVVQRRNRIVHQCDADPLTPGSVTPLSDTDALDAVKAVEQSVSMIDPHC